MSFIVSVPVKEDEYAERFAQRGAMDFYEYTEGQVQNMNVEFIVGFRGRVSNKFEKAKWNLNKSVSLICNKKYPLSM